MNDGSKICYVASISMLVVSGACCLILYDSGRPIQGIAGERYMIQSKTSEVRNTKSEIEEKVKTQPNTLPPTSQPSNTPQYSEPWLGFPLLPNGGG